MKNENQKTNKKKKKIKCKKRRYTKNEKSHGGTRVRKKRTLMKFGLSKQKFKIINFYPFYLPLVLLVVLQNENSCEVEGNWRRRRRGGDVEDAEKSGELSLESYMNRI